MSSKPEVYVDTGLVLGVEIWLVNQGVYVDTGLIHGVEIWVVNQGVYVDTGLMQGVEITVSALIQGVCYYTSGQ